MGYVIAVSEEEMETILAALWWMQTEATGMVPQVNELMDRLDRVRERSQRPSRRSHKDRPDPDTGLRLAP